jgi:hypothetical protein
MKNILIFMLLIGISSCTGVAHADEVKRVTSINTASEKKLKTSQYEAVIAKLSAKDVKQKDINPLQYGLLLTPNSSNAVSPH